MHSNLLILNVDIVVLLYVKNENQLHMPQAMQQGRVQARPAPLPARGGGGTGQTQGGKPCAEAALVSGMLHCTF